MAQAADPTIRSRLLITRVVGEHNNPRSRFSQVHCLRAASMSPRIADLRFSSSRDLSHRCSECDLRAIGPDSRIVGLKMIAMFLKAWSYLPKKFEPFASHRRTRVDRIRSYCRLVGPMLSTSPLADRIGDGNGEYDRDRCGRMLLHYPRWFGAMRQDDLTIHASPSSAARHWHLWSPREMRSKSCRLRTFGSIKRRKPLLRNPARTR